MQCEREENGQGKGSEIRRFYPFYKTAGAPAFEHGVPYMNGDLVDDIIFKYNRGAMTERIEPMQYFRIGIDNYSIFPLQLEPLKVLQWAKKHGAEGVSFSGLPADQLTLLNDAMLRDIKQFAESENLYLEWGGAQHIPRELSTWSQKDIFNVNRAAARQAEVLGCDIVRSCSGGLMRWHSSSPMTETLLYEMAETLRSQKSMLQDHGVVLAIETHFEFTSWELLRLFDMCDAEPGEYLGICFDTLNVLTMLEDPVLAVERLLPWIVTTHIKDGALQNDDRGFRSFTTAIGHGIVDFLRILRRLRTLQRPIHLNIEDHGGDFELPIFDPLFLSKFPDLSTAELTRLMQLAQQSDEKMQAGEIDILNRSDWPALCETRVQQDIVSLKQIRGALNDRR